MIHSNMAHAWFCQLRKAWNACQADMAQQKNKAGMVCEIWLETSPYKDQPKQTAACHNCAAGNQTLRTVLGDQSAFTMETQVTQ